MGRVGTGRKTSRSGRGTHGEVWDLSGDPRSGLGLVGAPSGKFGTGRKTSKTGQGTLRKVRDGSKDLRKFLGRVQFRLGRSKTGRGPSGRSGTGRRTFGEVWDGSGELRVMSRDPRSGLKRVGGPSGGPGLVGRP